MCELGSTERDIKKRSDICRKWSISSIFFLVLIIVVGAFAFYYVDSETRKIAKSERDALSKFIGTSSTELDSHLEEISKQRRRLLEQINMLRKDSSKDVLDRVINSEKLKSETTIEKGTSVSNRNSSIRIKLAIQFLDDFYEYSGRFNEIIRPDISSKIDSSISKLYIVNTLFDRFKSNSELLDADDVTDIFQENINSFSFDKNSNIFNLESMISEDIENLIPVSVKIIDDEIDEIKNLRQKFASRGYKIINNEDGTYSISEIAGVSIFESNIDIYREVATRITLVILVFIALQVVVSVFRYNARLSGFYSGRADAIKYLGETGQSQLTTSEFERLMSSFTPDNYDFVKQPKTPVDHSFELAKGILNRR